MRKLLRPLRTNCKFFTIYIKFIVTIALCTLINTNSIANAGNNDFLQGSAYALIGLEEDLDPYLLYSISLVEAAKATEIKSPKTKYKYIAPHPYAIRTPKGAIYPKTYSEAVDVLHQQLKNYKKSQLDIGLMQINGQHLNKVSNPEDLLSPTTNIRIASKILKEALRSKPDNFIVGIGRYHSYTHWRAQAYGTRVIAVYNNLKNL